MHCLNWNKGFRVKLTLTFDMENLQNISCLWENYHTGQMGVVAWDICLNVSPNKEYIIQIDLVNKSELLWFFDILGLCEPPYLPSVWFITSVNSEGNIFLGVDIFRMWRGLCLTFGWFFFMLGSLFAHSSPRCCIFQIDHRNLQNFVAIWVLTITNKMLDNVPLAIDTNLQCQCRWLSASRRQSW